MFEIPKIACHGAISTTVNLDAISVFLSNILRNNFGFSLRTPHMGSSLDIYLCASGATESDMRFMAYLFDKHFCSVSINDLYVIRDHVEDAVQSRLLASTRRSGSLKNINGVDAINVRHTLSFHQICILLEICGYDCDIIMQFYDIIEYNINHSADLKTQGICNIEKYEEIREFLKVNLRNIELSLLFSTYDDSHRTTIEKLINSIRRFVYAS